MPAEVGPGAEIPLDVQLNRQEEVDLIVSVFDESLLGVSGDLSKNIRDYYLADARGQGRAARELAATRFGARHSRGVGEEGRGTAEGQGPAREGTGAGAAACRPDRASGRRAGLSITDVVTLVRLTGLEVYLAHPMSALTTVWRVPRTATLADLLRWDRKTHRRTRT